jgi:hypothetical protein
MITLTTFRSTFKKPDKYYLEKYFNSAFNFT